MANREEHKGTETQGSSSRSGNYNRINTLSHLNASSSFPTRDSKIRTMAITKKALPPSEKTDLFKTHPEVAHRMESLLHQYASNGRSTPGAPQKNEVSFP